MQEPDWRRLPSLSSLRAFEAAARLGGFSAAGRALNVTHAAVAQQVRGLEADLGVALLHREGRGLALTEEGERLARALREGFATIATAVEALRAGERRRGIRVTATPAFSQSILMPRLGNFWRHHPEVAVSITPDFQMADLRRDGFDLAVRSGAGQWPGVVAEPLTEDRLMLAAAPSLLARGLDLAELPWILDPKDEREPVWLRTAGLDLDRLTLSGIDSPVLAIPAATAGYGLLFAGSVVIRDELASGRLVEVPFPGLPSFHYWIVTLSGPRRPAVDQFIAWLRKQFASPSVS